MKRLSKIYVFTTFVLIAVAFTFQNCGQGFNATEIPAAGVINSGSNGYGLSEKDSDVRVGELMTTDVGRTQGFDINGRATMNVRGTNSSDVYLFVTGLTPGTSFMSHIHNLPCAVGAGGHYKIDPSVTATLQNNELWITLNADATGVASGWVSVANHRLRNDAVSLIIHNADSSRIACVDFNSERKATIKAGAFTTLAAGVTAGKSITGTASIVRNANGVGQTIVKYSVAGLTPLTLHNTHVHAQPCALQEGGGHYKLNSAVTEAIASAAGEIWLPVTTGSTGTATAQVAVRGHVARDDAMSIVIHDPVTPANRLACVDLATDGGVISTELGLSRGRILSGKAQMERTANSTTKISLSVSGLLPSTMYVPHVHERPCNISGGGGHYKIDPTISAVIESNEIWLAFTTDATGSGSVNREIMHMARPEAQSIVIHDPTDAGRIACVDLY